VHVAREDRGLDSTDQDRVARYGATDPREPAAPGASILSVLDPGFKLAVSLPERPARFEAGTASIADAVGLGAALDYVQQRDHQPVVAGISPATFGPGLGHGVRSGEIAGKTR